MSVILVIDEQRVFRNGIRELIEVGIRHSRVTDGRQLDDFAADQHFELILIAVEALNDRSIHWLDTARELNPDARFAITSTSTDRADVMKCLSAGFHGFVYKLQSDKDLLAAINDLLSGGIHVPHWLVDGEADQSRPTHSIVAQIEIKELTHRQSDILPLIAQGMSNKEISSHLKIAEGTTKIHIAALIRALGARNRTEAAFIAAKLVGSSDRSKDQFKKLGPRFNLRNTIRS